jgi:hypothetical protein
LPAGTLVALNIPGWPRAISVDLLWNKKAPPGKPEAGCVSIYSARNPQRGANLCDLPHFF